MSSSTPMLVCALVLVALGTGWVQAAEVSRPRLYFSADDVARLRARADTTDVAIWEELRGWCDGHLDDKPPPRLPGDGYDEKGMYVEANFLSRITLLSFAYVISSDERYLQTAKRWLLALARMPEWAGRCGNRPDAGLYAGLGEIALAAGYDWLYQELTPTERKQVRDRMATVAATLYEATREGEWWTGAYWHHDLIIPVAGLGVAALALSPEVPEAARWLDQAVAETQAVLERVGDDGAWHEGVAPWAFGTTALLLFLDPLDRVTGRGFWDHRWLRETAWYRLYCWLPPDRVVNFDDCHRDGGYSSLTRDCAAILYRLASQYDNPYAQWLGDVESAAKRNADSSCWRFLWRDPSVEPQPPTQLPPSRFFANQDLLISRAGWTAEDPVLAFTCGATIGRRGLSFAVNADCSPNLGANTGSDHTHADQLSFMIYANGGYLMGPPGYGRKEAPEENCILVDGRGPRRYADSVEAIAGAGKATQALESAGFDVVVGEASACYPPELGVRQAERVLAYAKPDMVLLSDTVSLEQPRRVEWRFHAGSGVSIKPECGEFRFLGRRATLRFTVLSPADLEASVQEDQRHQWLSLRWPNVAAEARVRVLMQIVLLKAP